jgi:hypothetical protein
MYYLDVILASFLMNDRAFIFLFSFFLTKIRQALYFLTRNNDVWNRPEIIHSF